MDKSSFISEICQLPRTMGKVFTFSMSVYSCDLLPCLQMPYVDISKGKRECNLKNKDLPKILPNTHFEIR